VTTRSALAVAVGLAVAVVVGVLAVTTTSAPFTRETASAPASMCTFSQRGIPSAACGPLLGATYDSNSDPSRWEAELGRPLGVRRTYWAADEVRDGVAVAKDDIASQRIPWISFKLPYDWSDMAAGEGDEWVHDLARRLSALDGPVWIALHHEPEGDGDIADWRAMQERLAPIVRGTARNVAYSAILTGLHQVSRNPRFELNSVWPDTMIDIAGFDPYNWYGTETSEGVTDTKEIDMKKVYFDPISRWAELNGVAWAVAETGYTDVAHALDPTWLPRTFAELAADGGIAMAYFNTPLNSERTWTWVLGSPGKKAAFADALSHSARVP
jgi:hypothetical protein